jgi:hypothetical protein
MRGVLWAAGVSAHLPTVIAARAAEAAWAARAAEAAWAARAAEATRATEAAWTAWAAWTAEARATTHTTITAWSAKFLAAELTAAHATHFTEILRTGIVGEFARFTELAIAVLGHKVAWLGSITTTSTATATAAAAVAWAVLV